VANFCVSPAVVGLSALVISLGEVVMYFSYCTCPMTADPISAPSRRASGLRALKAMLGLDTPRVASAEAARAVGALQPAEARPPKDDTVPRAAWATSSGVISYSSAWACTEAAPSAKFIASPSPRPVTLDKMFKSAAVASLAIAEK